ncbi:MAG: protein translocase subunit SecDF [Cyclobacteriaceae bacterium]|nr:protein translocase subunit SecDF [Cyclobacteriaceae bacterium]MCH8514985.1 protein translocase subunit SecDF [Cyclobacteriaceae bacterium]
MQNRFGVIALTLIVTLLCVYYLSFSFKSRSIQKQAVEYATDADGNVDFAKKQSFLDSIWTRPVYNFLGIEYTYQDIKDHELGLGLDLQGGMNVTLQISPIEIIKVLAADSKNPAFLEALEEAKKRSVTSQQRFSTLFYDEFKQRAPETPLSELFATAANRGKISSNSSDSDILKVLDEEIDDAIDRSFNILRTRIDRFGTSQPNIQRLQNTGRISIEIPGADNPERVRNLLQGVAKLEFWEVYEINDVIETLERINDFLMKERVAQRATEAPASEEADVDQAEGDDLFDDEAAEGEDDEALFDGEEDAEEEDEFNIDDEVSSLFSLLRSQQGLIYEVKDTMAINRILKRPEVQQLIPSNLMFRWQVKPDKNMGGDFLELYALKTNRERKAKLTGEVITDARQDFDQVGQPAVSMRMNAQGARKWKAMTGENIGNRVAIVLDDFVYSAPNVRDEIAGGSSSISGNFTVEEAKDLANILKAGALPAPTQIVEEAIVGPTLGVEAQRQGITSILAGLAVVVLFMILYYSKGGLVANIALVFNIFFLLGILAQLDAALTLPGIAGIVLTIGMAIDANVLIFERIREELRAGTKIKEAISLGYSKAYSSIVDANVTTFLTGVILYTLGSGPVKGFAITLMIGIACSFFAAVFITRVIVDFLTRKGEKSNFKLGFAFTNNVLSNVNIDFLSRRKVAYIFSSSVIALGIVLIFIQGGLNLGVDFKGGRSYIVQFPDTMVASDVKTSLGSAFEDAGTEVKTYGSNNVLKITTSYLVDDATEEADKTVESSLIAGLKDFTGFEHNPDAERASSEEFSIVGSSKVGATIASDIKRASQQAIVFSLIAIFLYIFVRFRKWQFGLGSVVALFHDTLFVLSVFAIARALGFAFEIDQVFIAAMLTIIGYSINDTVIVFDRIREDLGLRPTADLTKTFNLAINNTISRTLVTSATTLVVVLILFIFGGEVLRGFSFALLIGILVGTYSSIYIATPVVLDLTKRKPIAEKEKSNA